MTPGEMNLQDVSELVTVGCMYLPIDFTRQLEGIITMLPAHWSISTSQPYAFCPPVSMVKDTWNLSICYNRYTINKMYTE